MIIRTYELEFEAGRTVKRTPIGTKILSVCVKKHYEIGKVEEKIVAVAEVNEQREREGRYEDREFLLEKAGSLGAFEDYEYNDTIGLNNQTQLFHIISRII